MLISIIGIEASGSEGSIDPELQSLTMYSCGGSSPLMDISSTLLENLSILAEKRTTLSVTYTVREVTAHKSIGAKLVQYQEGGTCLSKLLMIVDKNWVPIQMIMYIIFNPFDHYFNNINII